MKNLFVILIIVLLTGSLYGQNNTKTDSTDYYLSLVESWAKKAETVRSVLDKTDELVSLRDSLMSQLTAEKLMQRPTPQSELIKTIRQIHLVDSLLCVGFEFSILCINIYLIQVTDIDINKGTEFWGEKISALLRQTNSLFTLKKNECQSSLKWITAETENLGKSLKP